jgi:hypothetical protein
MTYDHWKSTEPDSGWEHDRSDDEREELYAQLANLIASHDRLLEAAKGLLQFNEELCAEINVSKHYPSAEKARIAIAEAEKLS